MCAWQFFAEASAKHGNAEFKKVPVGCCVPFSPLQAPTGSTHWLVNCWVTGGSTVRNQLTGGIAASLLCHSVVALGWYETGGSCCRKLQFPPILSCFDGMICPALDPSGLSTQISWVIGRWVALVFSRGLHWSFGMAFSFIPCLTAVGGTYQTFASWLYCQGTFLWLYVHS